MSIPEKEFLSKKKCLHEVICFPDGHISIERRAIAYSNQHYIYVIVPGNDELVEVYFTNIHDSEDIKTVLDDLFLAKRRSFEASSYFWDKPDIADERLREFNKSYLQTRIEHLKKDIERAQLTYDVQRRTFEASIENCQKQLKELEEK